MDLLTRAPALSRRPALVAGALALVAAGQVAALVRTPALPDDVRLRAEAFGYGFDVEEDLASVTFHLTNDGDRPVRVLGVGRDGPGLTLVDVEASGEPLGFRSRGAGPDGLPAFGLDGGTTVVLRLSYRAASCLELDPRPFPVPLRVQAGRASDDVRVPLPRLPDDGVDAAPEGQLEWQTVLARDLCGPG